MEDTIAAISTAVGEGGIGIVRISGPEALTILSALFRPARAGAPLKEQTPVFEDRKLTYGFIVDPETGETVDEVLAAFLPGPATYTREDIAEIDCHGGPVPLRRTLRLALRLGARPAEPGEFTQRAFLNGRIDLSQAEAVMDLISARTDSGADAALSQLSGALSGEIRAIRALLMDILVDLTVNIDYPDEDIEHITYEALRTALGPVIEKTAQLLETTATGKILHDGLRAAIIGKPNVGKSSLMNRLLRESRAIVTDIPGTTRDTIEETLSVRGIPVILTDTAGIRQTDDMIESIGIERSLRSLEEADLVIFLVDSSRPLDEEDRAIIASLSGPKTIAVLNKTDLSPVVRAEDLQKAVPGAEVIRACMKDGDGVREIEDTIVRRVYGGTVRLESRALVTNARQEDLLRQAEAQMRDADRLAALQEPLEIIELGLQDAYEKLGGIIGEAVQDDILQEVFSRFCLGK